MPIEILPAQLANQIAAGEVVERPASVVKELIENSLDAGATDIRIEIQRGGHKLIRIQDNGAGIAKEQLTLALSRHATSKLKSLDDLENICSLGFRGEALASISSVSRLTLSSKPAEQSQAWQACAQGRDMQVQIQPTAHPNGTSIEVKDLFFNTPARRKFLRTEKTEFTHIDELIKRIALSRFDVSFTLTHNQKVVRQYRASQDEQQQIKRVAQVAGKGFLTQALRLESGEQGLHIHGWVMPLHSQTEPQYTYVNGRMMRDKLILHAIRQAFEQSVGAGDPPAFVLYLAIDPRQVDVNVHPAKHEVRFHQARLVHDFIVHALTQVVSAQQEPLLAEQTTGTAPKVTAQPLRAEEITTPANEMAYDPSTSVNSHSSRASKNTGGGAAHNLYSRLQPAQLQQANQFYQGISERQAGEFSYPAATPVTDEATTRGNTAEFTTRSWLNLADGNIAFNQQGQLYVSHWRNVLIEHWQQQLQDQAQLPSKALLLPVRISLKKDDQGLLQHALSWLTVLGFDLTLNTQFLIIKKLPVSLYLLDVQQVINEVLTACRASDDTLDFWLNWQHTHTPNRYFNSDEFTAQISQLEKNQQITDKLQQKAVKIPLHDFLTTLNEEQTP